METGLINFAQRMVQTRSYSGEESEVISLIAEEMRGLQYDEVFVDANGSVIGIINGKKPGKTLLLDGHCDTVRVNEAEWSHPPFGGVIENGYLYGRGAADMKGALAAMIHAAAGVDRSRLAGRVVVSATVIEELMEGISFKNVVDQVKPDFVIIGEATNFTLNRAGRGRAEIVAETFGIPAHSSSPQAGKCAVHAMMQLIDGIESTPLPEDPFVGKAQMTLTDIISEPYPGHSVVPSYCRVSYDRRLIPGETPESILEIFKANPTIQSIDHKLHVLEGEKKTYTESTLKGLKFFPAWKFDEESFFVQSALNGLKHAGFTPNLGSFQFCTNGAYSGGVAGIPTIGYGPGMESDAHVIDEKIKIDDLEQAMSGYEHMIQDVLS